MKYASYHRYRDISRIMGPFGLKWFLRQIAIEMSKVKSLLSYRVQNSHRKVAVRVFLLYLLSSLFEEIGEKVGAFFLQNAFGYLCFGVQRRFGISQVTPLLVRGSEYKPSHLRPAYGTGAHDTGFECNV